MKKDIFRLSKKGTKKKNASSKSSARRGLKDIIENPSAETEASFTKMLRRLDQAMPKASSAEYLGRRCNW